MIHATMNFRAVKNDSAGGIVFINGVRADITDQNLGR